ncbi:ankyrin repeat-containing domain protein [Xylaria flabelliformis]|nr:ankyrin repeat-containing domain protein [Xylaria flabelliformis]
MTPLAIAASSGEIDVMKKLIRKGVNKEAFAASVGPVVNTTIISGTTEAVTMLIEMGVKLSYADEMHSGEGQNDERLNVLDNEEVLPPLALEALISDISLFRTILEAGKSSMTDMERILALNAASVSGRIEVIEKLLDYEYESLVFQLALESAAKENNWDVVRHLLQNCSELNCEDLFKWTSTGSEKLEDLLDDCWKYTNGSFPQELLDNCLYTATDVEKQRLGTALQAACNNGHIEIAELLLDKGANPNLGGGRFTRPIIATIFQQDTSSKLYHRLLQSEGLDLEFSGGPFNSTPIHYVALFLSAEDVRTLIGAGAPVDIEDDDGDTALIAATATGDSDTVKLLLENNADFTIANRSGLTALDLAAQLRHAECVRLLVGRASKIMRELRESAGRKDETALRIMDSERESRFESMSLEPKKADSYLEVPRASTGERDLERRKLEKEGPENTDLSQEVADLMNIYL